MQYSCLLNTIPIEVLQDRLRGNVPEQPIRGLIHMEASDCAGHSCAGGLSPTTLQTGDEPHDSATGWPDAWPIARQDWRGWSYTKHRLCHHRSGSEASTRCFVPGKEHQQICPWAPWIPTRLLRTDRLALAVVAEEVPRRMDVGGLGKSRRLDI